MRLRAGTRDERRLPLRQRAERIGGQPAGVTNGLIDATAAAAYQTMTRRQESYLPLWNYRPRNIARAASESRSIGRFE